MADRATAHRILLALRQTSLGDEPILVGSSGLFGFETRVPALTEDIDLAIPEVLAAAKGDRLVAELEERGFEHPAGTATFVAREDGTTFDLLGYGEAAAGDHIGGGGLLRVMVFEDLSRLLAEQKAISPLPACKGLSPAGFVVVKLLTERVHKGAKDKIQALLVLAERAKDEAFLEDVRFLLGQFDEERIDDAIADAQGAFMALARDPGFRDAGAEGYAEVAADAERGLATLLGVLDA